MKLNLFKKEPKTQNEQPEQPKAQIKETPQLAKVIDSHIQNDVGRTMAMEKHEHDKETRQTLIWKIQKYQNSSRFGDFVRHTIRINQTEAQLNKLHNDDLQDILSKIRIQLDNRNLDSFYNGLIKGGASLGEAVLRDYYNIDGFGEELLANKTFMDALERYKIESPFKSVPPSLQIAYAFFSTAIMTHELNKRTVNRNVQIKPQMTPLNKNDKDFKNLPPEIQEEMLLEMLGVDGEELVVLDDDELETIPEGSENESENSSENGSEESEKTPEPAVVIPNKNIGDVL